MFRCGAFRHGSWYKQACIECPFVVHVTGSVLRVISHRPEGTILARAEAVHGEFGILSEWTFEGLCFDDHGFD
jgi:hypothetical protein